MKFKIIISILVMLSIMPNHSNAQIIQNEGITNYGRPSEINDWLDFKEIIISPLNDTKIWCLSWNNWSFELNPMTSEWKNLNYLFGDSSRGLSYKNMYKDPCNDNYIWFANFHNGFGRLDLNQKKYEQWNTEKYFNRNAITTLKIQQNYIWIGSANGLYKYDRIKNALSEIPNTNGIWITNIALFDDTIWINGEYKFNPNKNEIIKSKMPAQKIIENDLIKQNFENVKFKTHFQIYDTEKFFDTNGVWLNTSLGCIKLENGNLKIPVYHFIAYTLDKKYFWTNTINGILKISKDFIDKSLIDEDEAGNFKRFDLRVSEYYKPEEVITNYPLYVFGEEVYISSEPKNDAQKLKKIYWGEKLYRHVEYTEPEYYPERWRQIKKYNENSNWLKVKTTDGINGWVNENTISVDDSKTTFDSEQYYVFFKCNDSEAGGYIENAALLTKNNVLIKYLGGIDEDIKFLSEKKLIMYFDSKIHIFSLEKMKTILSVDGICPVFTPNRKSIIYLKEINGRSAICRINIDGSNYRIILMLPKHYDFYGEIYDYPCPTKINISEKNGKFLYEFYSYKKIINNENQEYYLTYKYIITGEGQVISKQLEK